MDIKKPDIGVILEKLSFLKNNLALLVPIVLVVVAGLLFIPTALFHKSLIKKTQSESVSKGSTLDSMSRNGIVPKDQFEVEQQNLKTLAQDANEIKRLNSQCLQRSLLSYRIFPAPTDMSSQKYEDFGRAFCEGILDMVQNVKGTVSPSETELGMQAGGMGMTGRNGMRNDPRMALGRDATGRDAAETEEELLKQSLAIEDAICSDKAMAGLVYVLPADIVGYDFWSSYAYNTSAEEAIKTCWTWQHGYWIVEDVFQTIAQCNNAAGNVFDAPVKRLMSLKYEQHYSGDDASDGGRGTGRGVMRPGQSPRSMDRRNAGGGGRQNIPMFVETGSQAIATPVSARYSNEDYNIVHFNVVVVVEAAYQVEFMKALCSAKTHKFYGFKGDQPEQTFQHNQITILASEINPVVRNDMAHSYYRYGEDAVIELSLTCEYLLPVEAYAELIPEVLKPVTDEAQF